MPSARHRSSPTRSPPRRVEKYRWPSAFEARFHRGTAGGQRTDGAGDRSRIGDVRSIGSLSLRRDGRVGLGVGLIALFLLEPAQPYLHAPALSAGRSIRSGGADSISGIPSARRWDASPSPSPTARARRSAPPVPAAFGPSHRRSSGRSTISPGAPARVGAGERYRTRSVGPRRRGDLPASSPSASASSATESRASRRKTHPWTWPQISWFIWTRRSVTPRTDPAGHALSRAPSCFRCDSTVPPRR